MKTTAFAGKTALVTGSTSGIGAAIGLALAGMGCRVAFNGRRERSLVEDLLGRASRDGHADCIYIRADVGTGDGRKRLVEQVKHEFGGLDVLVNNAGVTTAGRADMLELTEEQMLGVFRTNLIGPYLLSSALVPVMSARSEISYMINISSISAYTASVNRADYCMSKAGMSMMTKLFALRLAPENVRVFEIRPGIIHTDMTETVREKYDVLIHDGLLPIPRWGEPGDIARCVVSIVEGNYDYATGEVFNIDGGFHLRSL